MMTGSMNKDTCTAVFMKSPERGRVKTRLAATVGEKAATDLYRCFVTDVVNTVKMGPWEMRLFFHPPEKKNRLVSLLGNTHTFMPQAGEDLGQRMANAIERLFAEGFRRVVLIGSDLPDLPQGRIEKAFRCLREKDGVIGPSPDGGYYLIGFRRESYFPAVFENMPWSRGTLLEKTQNAFSERGFRCGTLEPWLDIDTVHDLKRFRDDGNRSSAPFTWAYLSGAPDLFDP